MTYAGGGGGNGGSGGTGGGGAAGGQGTDGLGGGGGGMGGPSAGGRGGAGRVVMRYLGTSGVTSGGTPSAIAGTDWQVVQFTTTGTSSLSGTLSFTTGAASLVATQSGAISGTGSLTYDSPGTLTLGAANTHTGSTFVKAGTLNLGHVNALQNSTLDLRAADAGAIGFTVAGTNTYAIGGLAGSRNLAIGSNTLAVGGNNSSTTYSGVLSGTGSLRKAGLGSLTLSGANDYTGGTLIASGTLALEANERLADTGTVTVSGGAFDLGGFTETVAGVTMSGGVMRNGGLNTSSVAATAGTIDGALAGSTALTKSGAGELVVRGANTHSGGTVISAGILVAESNAVFGSGGVELGAARLRLGDGVAIGNGLTLTSAANTTALDITAVTIEYLVVGGGGGGAGLEGAGGGGGGGGYVVSGSTTLASRQTAVVVGAGGAAGGNGGVTGGASSFTNPLTAVTAAGGAGGGYDFTGGTAGGSSASTIDGVTTSYTGGNPNSTAARRAGGGGAGAGGNGTNAAANTGGIGGVGIASAISGTSTYYGGGGGGGAEYAGSTPTPGAGGLGGGGRGAGNVSGQTGFSASVAGTPNTGGGGGGAGGVNNVASGYNGAAGGSGVVIMRYAGPQIATGGTVTTVGGDTVHTFTSASDALTFTSTPTARLDGVVGGAGGFTWSSFGDLTLGGANTYEGGTIISDGGVYAGHDTAFGSGTVTIATAWGRVGAAANVSIANPIALDAAGVFDSGAFTPTVTGVIAGVGSLTKQGSGTLTLSGTNTYAGGTTVSAGTLRGTTASLQGAITNDATVEFSQATDGEYAGVIGGTGGLAKSDSGRVTLSGANTFAGATTVSGGTLATSTANRLPAGNAVAITAGATLELGGSQTLGVVTGSGGLNLAAGTLTVGATTGEFAGSITGSGDLVKSGAGTFTLSGANTFTGDVTVSGGTLLLASDAALNAATDVALTSGATLNVASGRIVRVNSFTLTQGTLAGTGALEALTTTVDSATIETPIEDAPGQSSNFVKTGTGTTTVNAANTFTGTVDVQAGTVQLGANGSFAAASSLQLATGATLDLAGRSQTFAGVSGAGGTISLGAGTLTVNAAAGNTFAGVITGSGGLSKQGGGDFVLSGTSTYSGPTSVASGRLSVNGSLGNTPVAVLAAAELGGSGHIGGPVSIASGGTLAPGNSIASLAAGATSFSTGATFDYEVDSSNLGALGTAADLLVVSGNLDIASGTLLSFTDIAGVSAQPFVEDTTVFAMINYSGTWNSGLFTYNGTPLADGSRFFVGSQQWEIDYNYMYDTVSPTTIRPLNYQGDYLPSSGTQTFVAITAVPEPSTYAMALAGLTIGGYSMWRRRKRV
ncbi:MAG: autotransporter-associated beta strand repeat-containing protein [Planctomycetia bacterium]